MPICFFDLDGTVLSHTSNSVPASTIRGIQALQARGIPCVLNTGRHYAELVELGIPDVLSFDAYCLLTGAYNIDRDHKYLFGSPFPEAKVHEVLNWCRQRNYAAIIVVEAGLFTCHVNDLMRQIQAAIHSSVPPMADPGQIDKEPIYQITVFAPRGEGEKMVQEVGGVKASWWQEQAFDLSTQAAGKGFALQQMCRRAGIPVAESYAFGDNNNDLEMLAAAGISIAMGNGSAEAKAASDYVTDDIDRDGLYKALVHFGLLEERK